MEIREDIHREIVEYLSKVQGTYDLASDTVKGYMLYLCMKVYYEKGD